MSGVERMVTISARVPESLSDGFEALAKRHYRSFSAELRKVMHEYLLLHAGEDGDAPQPERAA